MKYFVRPERRGTMVVAGAAMFVGLAALAVAQLGGIGPPVAAPERVVPSGAQRVPVAPPVGVTKPREMPPRIAHALQQP